MRRDLKVFVAPWWSNSLPSGFSQAPFFLGVYKDVYIEVRLVCLLPSQDEQTPAPERGWILLFFCFFWVSVALTDPKNRRRRTEMLATSWLVDTVFVTFIRKFSVLEFKLCKHVHLKIEQERFLSFIES